MLRSLALGLALLGFLGSETAFGQAAEPAANVVYLSQSRDWLIFRSGWGGVSPLARELARQAFLIAARDELGLATRDGWLGATMPSEGPNAPWEFRAQPQSPVTVRLQHGFASHEAEVAQYDLQPAVFDNWRFDYRRLTELQEKFSRAEYVQVLKGAGYDGHSNARVENLEVPEATEQRLGQMNFLAQFRAVRELHALMHEQGESPAILGALVRAYANLGWLTEYYWHPAHKVFKARALLYAQRMLATAPASPVALWHRAYAAALTGNDRWAADDLKEAKKVGKELPEATRPAPPAWVQWIEGLSRYDADNFRAPVGDVKLLPLATLLRFAMVERAGGSAWATQTAMEALPIIPDCYRIHDSLCQFGGEVLLKTACTAPIERAGRTLYDWVRAMPGLPAEVGEVVRDDRSLTSVLQQALGKEDEYHPREEFPRRERLIEALLKAGQELSPADNGELSWDTLGLLIRELSFLQASWFVRNSFNGMPEGDWEEWLSSIAILGHGHPYEAWLGLFTGDWEQASKRLVSVDAAGLEFHAHGLYEKLYREPEAMRFHDECGRNIDFVSRDLVVLIRHYGSQYREETSLDWLGHTLWFLSPDSPMAHRVMIETDWDNVQERVPSWDREAMDFPGLASALAKRYLDANRLDDAERLLKAALKQVPWDVACRGQLALVYRQRGQEDRWEETLREQYEKPDYGGEQTTVRSALAYYYLGQKQYARALAYAQETDESAESGWGLRVAGACFEGLQQWDEAELRYRSLSSPSYSLPWYFFCRRTGHGDLSGARQLVQQQLQMNPEWLDHRNLVAYYLLEGDTEQALTTAEKLVEEYHHAIDCVWVALLADRLHQDAKRDAAWEMVKDAAVHRGTHVLLSWENGALDLAWLIQRDLAEGGRGNLDLELVAHMGESLDPGDRLVLEHGVAEYLNQHGQTEAAEKLWKHCVSRLEIDSPERSLAGANLLSQGIPPEDYQALLQPEAPPEEKPAEKKPGE